MHSLEERMLLEVKNAAATKARLPLAAELSDQVLWFT
jgi:hypothetical protein